MAWMQRPSWRASWIVCSGRVRLAASALVAVLVAAFARCAPQAANAGQVQPGCRMVSDFGAVGDGRASDTAAFASAMKVSDCVQFPSGTFVVPSVDLRKRTLAIRGAGMDSTTLVATFGGNGHWIHSLAGRLDLSDFRVTRADTQTVTARAPGFADYVDWVPDTVGVKGSISRVRFEACPQVCVVILQLTDTAVIDSAVFTGIPLFDARRQTYAIVVRNDGRGPTGHGLLRVWNSTISDADAATGRCPAGGTAGGLFSYADLRAVPLSIDVRGNRFVCVGGADRRSPVGAVEMYAHVDGSVIRDNTFDRATYTAVKTAVSGFLTIVNNTIVDSDSAVLAPAISVAGCIRGPEYCTQAYGNWRVDSNQVIGFRSRGTAVRVGGGYAMARSAAADVVASDCGSGLTVNAQMVCTTQSGQIARPYLAAGVYVRDNVVRRADGAPQGDLGIDVSGVDDPIVTGNMVMGVWKAPVVVQRAPR